MAGCKKEGRNRKSVQNTVYKTSSRLKVNKEKKAVKEERRQTKKSIRYFDGKIKERGTARKQRRKGMTRGKKTDNSKVLSKQASTTFERSLQAIKSR